MARRSKTNPAVSAQSKLEMLEKRRLLSTTLALAGLTAVSDIASHSDGMQSVADGETSTDASADDAASLNLSSDSLGSDTTAAEAPSSPTVLPSDPITPISFDDVVSPLVDPVASVVDVTTPIEPVKFVDPTPPPVAAATDPTADVDSSVLPIDLIAPVSTPADGTISTVTTLASTDTTTTQDDTTSDLATTTEVTISASATDPQTTADPTTSNTSIDSQPVTPVVVLVPVVDQTDLGDSAPSVSATTSTDSTSESPSGSTLAEPSRLTPTSPTDSSDATTTSTAPVVRPPGTGQSSDDQAMDSGLSFMHVSLPPMLGGSHDGVSGFQPVYVSAALNTQQPSNSVARDSMTADAIAAQAQSRTSVHESVVTGTTAAATQGTFSTTPIQQQAEVQQEAVQQSVEPAMPRAKQAASGIDGDPVAAVVERNMDVTGPREEVATQLAEEHLKLTRLVWTFPTIDIEPQATEAAAQQPSAQTAGAKVAAVVADAAAAGPAMIQLVQEIDVAPADAATQAAAEPAGNANPRIVQIPVTSASVANSVNDSANRSRNIVLAVAAGVASLAVQAYRSSRRKLAAAARAAHLDPLAAWLDDPGFDRRD